MDQAKIINVPFESPARVERMRLIAGTFRTLAHGWAYQVAPLDGGASVIIPATRIEAANADK